MPLALRAFLTWCLLFALAMVNGALREMLLRPLVGAIALPLSTFTLMALLAPAIHLFVRRNPRLTLRQAWLIGVAWLILTLAAETVLTLATGRPAADVLAAFSGTALAAGNWVVLDFVFVAVAPVVLVKVRALKHS
jgi:hypothetical protein